MTSSPQFVPQKFCLFLDSCVFSRDCEIKLVFFKYKNSVFVCLHQHICVYGVSVPYTSVRIESSNL